MNKHLLRALACLFLFCSVFKSQSQTYNCYITNDHLVSATVYEFDEYIISTSSTFALRTVQNCFTFNPAFVDPAASIAVSMVPGSGQMVNFNPNAIQWSAAATGFQTASNTGVSCGTATLINNLNPVRIATWRIESSLPFLCAPANPNMVAPNTTNPPGLLLRMTITKYNATDCSTITASSITATGTFTQLSPLTGYDSVQNMKPTITSQPTNGSACNGGGLVTFAVTASAQPGMVTPVTFQWLENGVPVSNGATANGTYAGATTATLTITNPGASLIGHLFVCVISQCNTDTTVAVTITSSPNDNNACTTDACDPVTGIVTNTPINTDDGNACTTDACDPATGIVTHPAVNTNDNDGCTTDGCDPVTGLFHNPISTNDNNPCTADACDPATGSITHTLIATNDSNACTIDGCDPLSGVYHTQINTNDNNQCTLDVCDIVSGNITHTPLPTDDGNACTTDGCDSLTGVFHTLINIDDNNACTFDHCNTTTGAINHVPLITNDSNACTIDACDPLTGNMSHTPVVIDDNDACTVDACDVSTGNITHVAVIIDDNNACTTDACDPVSGVSNTPINIDDGINCTLDVCDPVNGNVSHTPITAATPSLTVADSCGYSILTASGFTGTLLWSTGDSTASITVSTSGSYTVTQNISGCISSPATISANPIPLPGVDIGPDTLVNAPNYILDPGAGFNSYLWSNGATSQTITVQSSGWFWVEISNGTCSNRDSVFVDFYLGINSTELLHAVAVYPNPNTGSFNLSCRKDLKDVRLEVYNSTGIKVYATEQKSLIANSIVNVNLKVTAGVYVVRMICDRGVFAIPVVVN